MNKNQKHTNESREKISKSLTGKRYPNRKPPEKYNDMPNHSGSKWYNNGEKNCRSKVHPGEGWILGKLQHKVRPTGPGIRRGFIRKDLENWAKIAKERVPFCEWCYSEDNLEAHHIMPKSKFPQYAYDLNNVRNMCKSCHVTCHKQGGY